MFTEPCRLVQWAVASGAATACTAADSVAGSRGATQQGSSEAVLRRKNVRWTSWPIKSPVHVTSSARSDRIMIRSAMSKEAKTTSARRAAHSPRASRARHRSGPNPHARWLPEPRAPSPTVAGRRPRAAAHPAAPVSTTPVALSRFPRGQPVG
jgi:hypothetical protein